MLARADIDRRGCRRSRCRSWRRSTRARRGPSWWPRARRGRPRAGTVQQASRAYEIADVRYRAGVSTQLELSDSRLLLQQAEANRALAARDLQVARARVALLPELPLGAGDAGCGAARRRAGPAAGADAATAAAGKRSVHKRGRATGAAADGDQVVMRVIRIANGSGRDSRRHDVAARAGARVLAAACGTTEAEKAPVAAAPAAVQIGPENVVTVRTGTIVVGPILSGELRPQREAKIRAELGGSMLEVLVEEGADGDARRAARPHRDAHARRRAPVGRVGGAQRREPAGAWPGARSSAPRSSSTPVRLPRATSTWRRATSRAVEAQLADAKSRLASAERQLGDAVIRAPIGGIVSKQAVNVGDVVSPGTELFTVIDPSSMRLEASVPSEDLSQLRVGRRGRVHGTGIRSDVRRDGSSGSRRRPTRRRGRCRSSSPFRTSAAGSWRASSPRAGSWRSRRPASSCR